MRGTQHDALPRFVLSRLLGERRQIAVDLALLRLRAHRQLAALRLERSDFTQVRRALAVQRLQLGLQTQHLFGFGLHLGRRHEVVVAQRLQPRLRLLRQREPLALQVGLGGHGTQLAPHVFDLPIKCGELVLLQRTALPRSALQALFAQRKA